MTDRQIVESILTCCGDSVYNIVKWNSVFNSQDQCIELYLSGEQLKEIPEKIYKLKHLEFLDLSCNKLTYIPNELKQIETLYTHENPILDSNDKVEILFNKGILNDR